MGKKNKKENKHTAEEKTSSKLEEKKAKKHDKKNRAAKKLQDADKEKRAHRRVKHKAPEGHKEPEIVEHPINEFRDDLKKKNKGHTHDELDDREEFNLFGDNLPLIEDKFEQEVEESRIKKTFLKGDTIKSEAHSYKIVKKLNSGPSVYKAQQSKSKQEFFVKFEANETLVRASRLGREVRLLKNSRKTDKHFRQHFLKMIDRGKIDNKYNFLVTQLGGPSLIDVRAKLKQGQFWPCDAVRLCMQTLQAVHDVHLCQYVHRDIQPKNFVIGREKQGIVYIVNFGLSFNYYPNENKTISIVAKYSWLSKKFQSRSFHNGYEYNRLSDMESWLYLCYWFFDGKCLPWEDASFADDDTSERSVCNLKELFLIGTYDSDMCEKTDRYLPTSLRAMRNKIYFEWLSAHKGPINYPFFAQAILEMMNEIDMDWSEPYQWQLSREDQRAVESFIKHGSHSGGGFCIACDNSPLAKRTFNIAAKSSEPKIKEHKKRKQTKPADNDSGSDSSSSSRSKNVKKNSDANAPEDD